MRENIFLNRNGPKEIKVLWKCSSLKEKKNKIYICGGDFQIYCLVPIVKKGVEMTIKQNKERGYVCKNNQLLLRLAKQNRSRRLKRGIHIATWKKCQNSKLICTPFWSKTWMISIIISNT